MLAKASHPFVFCTRAHMTLLTGYRARSVSELLVGIQKLSLNVIYYHTHRFLQQHQFLSPEPPNDFAYWITHNLREEALAERIAAVDVVQFSDLENLRERFITILKEYLEVNPPVRFVHEEQAFHFMDSISFILPTTFQAMDLIEFIDGIKNISIHSLYHHVFEARLRLHRGTNDFSLWLAENMGERGMSRAIQHLDPYTHTLEGLRQQILDLLNERLKEINHDAHR